MRVLLALVMLLLASPVRATDLAIQVRATDGKQVAVVDAELLLVAWGDVERIPLTFTFDAAGDVIHLPLDADWLRSHWSRADDIESAFIFLAGNDFVALRSERFDWPGIKGALGDVPRDQVTIDFGPGQDVTVHAGQTASITVAVRRRAQPRQLKFVDDDGRPVTGITVSAHMLWSTSNHCGVLAGNDPLVEGARPDAAGIVAVPDGDFPYAIEVFAPPHQRVDDPDVDANGVVETRLAQQERVIRMHSATRRPLAVQVFVGDQRVASPPLAATVKGNGCGARTGPLDDVNEFYPEEVEAVCLADDRGRTLWTLSTFDGQPATVRLPAGTRLGRAVSCSAR